MLFVGCIHLFYHGSIVCPKENDRNDLKALLKLSVLVEGTNLSFFLITVLTVFFKMFESGVSFSFRAHWGSRRHVSCCMTNKWINEIHIDEMWCVFSCSLWYEVCMVESDENSCQLSQTLLCQEDHISYTGM